MRNFGKVLGVFAGLDLTLKTSPQQTRADDLTIEIRRLAPPKWPEEILGKIDLEKGPKERNCAPDATPPGRIAGCEPKLEGKRFIENAIVIADVIGTDSMVFRSPQFDSLPTARPASCAAEHLGGAHIAGSDVP